MTKSEEPINGISNMARVIANKDSATFTIVFHDNYHTGNTLATILERSFQISKNRITKIGPISTDQQDALNLAQKRDIIIAPLRKGSYSSHYSPTFSPPDNSSKVMVITIQGDNATIYYFNHDRGPFRLT